MAAGISAGEVGGTVGMAIRVFSVDVGSFGYGEGLMGRGDAS